MRRLRRVQRGRCDFRRHCCSRLLPVVACNGWQSPVARARVHSCSSKQQTVNAHSVAQNKNQTNRGAAALLCHVVPPATRLTACAGPASCVCPALLRVLSSSRESVITKLEENPAKQRQAAVRQHADTGTGRVHKPQTARPAERPAGSVRPWAPSRTNTHKGDRCRTALGVVVVELFVPHACEVPPSDRATHSLLVRTHSGARCTLCWRSHQFCRSEHARARTTNAKQNDARPP